jgi:GT2 family glycosyltransferase
MSAPVGDETVKVEGAVMACFLIPRKVIDKIGLLQENTFMYFEDIEYSRRAKENNIPIYYVPNAEFIHYHGQSSKRAGLDLSVERMVKAAKWYHGLVDYWMVTAVLWAGQKWGKVKNPISRWTK